ncbi:MAG TPA: PAS domain-containing protein, partial [Acidimicrobiales bacterium]|nr:PAS domain-containing protein [Acidimicrobiales bacterium]
MPVEDLSRELMALAQAEASPDGILVVSPEGRMLFWNRSFADIWHLPPEVMTAADDVAALHAAMDLVADPEGFRTRVQEIYDNPVGRFQDEIELSDGRILDRFGAPLHGDDGDYLGLAWYFRDVTFHRRTERDLRELADTLQASLLPPLPPQIPGMEVATHYLPADRHVAVGGDFFDVFRLATNEWGLAIGDVCGKGAKAAALTALARYTLRAAAGHSGLPSAVLQ